MKFTEAQELEELALLAELARPLVHECNNFLNNLLLQLAISENDLPAAHRPDWERLRRDGKKMGRLLQEWQRQRKSFADGPAKTEVRLLLQQIAEASASQENLIPVSLRLPAEPLWLAGSGAELKRLIWILLRYASAGVGMAAKEPRALEIKPGLTEGQIILRMQENGPAPAVLSWRDFDVEFGEITGDSTLLVAACKSLTERLKGSIRVEECSPDRFALVLALPAALEGIHECTNPAAP